MVNTVQNDTNVYDEIKKLWSEKYSFNGGENSDNLKNGGNAD